MSSGFISYTQISTSAKEFKQRALVWADQFKIVAFYEHNQIAYPYGGFSNILAVTNHDENLLDTAQAFSSLEAAVNHSAYLLCGFFTYDLKNQIEKLSSSNPDYIGFPEAYFFQPEIYLEFAETGFTIFTSSGSASEILKQILATACDNQQTINSIKIYSRVSKKEYITQVENIRQDILNGEVYEINYCQEFFAEGVSLNPVTTFQALNHKSPMPFAGYFKLHDTYLLCASPERFLKKEGNKLLSQPIKGTVRRGQTTKEDQILKDKLRTDEKEIAENMMIMDLVRNDLSKSCKTGSVQVEEMFGIYAFRQVFQMITTVSGTLRDDCSGGKALENAFPMGSMTGAPKIRAMQLIENYEKTRRGLFSGSIGYIKPNGDFDFNVVIRSLQYNAQTGYLSFMVGSAITYDSVPEQEYEECLLKAQVMMEILTPGATKI